MSKSRKSPKGRSGRRSPRSPKSKFVPILVLALMGMAAVGYLLYFQKGSGSKQKAQSGKTESAVQVEDTRDPGPDARRLIGRWTRPDGGYTIEIRSVDAKGLADAGYFNPRPIHVSQAVVSKKDNGLELFLELQDAGYPGSTYNLNYDAQRDMLAGIYYQAAMNQSFEVIFLRAE